MCFCAEFKAMEVAARRAVAARGHDANRYYYHGDD
jgi:hypothetical protein